MIEELHAIAEGRSVGHVYWDRKRHRMSFQYDQGWRLRKDAYSISLSMPMAISNHTHTKVEAFLWGLLPDNNEILRQWGKKFQVSPRHPFQILQHVGEECAGAVQFVPAERSQKWMDQTGEGSIKWLDQSELESRIRLLLKDHSATRTSEDAGHFSLAGAQPKTAYYYDETKQRWGVPEGNMPTTHILKPATGSFNGFVENEHFCLRLAAELGFNVAHSSIEYIADCPVIIVKRYDRIPIGGKVRRIHQEDLCQALSVPPFSKYQNQGGPGPLEVISLLRDFSSKPGEDTWRFVEALAFNWLIGGTDAHAKNYSILIAGGGQVRLAPLYDIASSLPYPHDIPPRKAKMAMKIGSKYRLNEISGHEWEKLEKTLRLKSASLRDRIRSMAEKIPEKVGKVADELKKSGVTHEVVASLRDSLTIRSTECLKSL